MLPYLLPAPDPSVRVGVGSDGGGVNSAFLSSAWAEDTPKTEMDNNNTAAILANFIFLFPIFLISSQH